MYMHIYTLSISFTKFLLILSLAYFCTPPLVRTLGRNREETDKFRLSYYPHRLADFTKILREVFGADAELRTLGDFKELNDAETPAYFIHVVRKPF